jgi:SRSO17 transposase
VDTELGRGHEHEEALRYALGYEHNETVPVLEKWRQEQWQRANDCPALRESAQLHQTKGKVH